MKIWKTISALLRLRSCSSMSRCSFLVIGEQTGGRDFTQSVVDRAVGGEWSEDAGVSGLHFRCSRGDDLRCGDERPCRWRLEVECLVGRADRDGALDKSTGGRNVDTGFGDDHFGLLLGWQIRHWKCGETLPKRRLEFLERASVCGVVRAHEHEGIRCLHHLTR